MSSVFRRRDVCCYPHAVHALEPIAMSTTDVNFSEVIPLDSPSLAAPTPLNTLPDNGDGQANLLPSEQQARGVEVAVYLWPHPAAAGQTDIIHFYINDLWAMGERLA